MLESNFAHMITKCYMCSGDNFDNLLEPLQKLLRLSPPVAATLAHPELFFHTRRRLKTKKAVVRGNLLRVVRSICDAREQQGTLLRDHGLYDTVEKLANHDPAILVRNMASDLIKSSEASERRTAENGSRYSMSRRTSPSTMTPPSLYSSYSQPPTPSHTRSSQAASYFDIGNESVTRSRISNVNSTPYRPVSRDSSKANLDGTPVMGISSSGGPARSRLPRTSAARLTRSSTNFKREEVETPIVPTPQVNGHGVSGLRPTVAVNRRRRQTSGAG